ncbi:MAG: 4-hydroxy-tetrahydrodipicolinate reductase [Bacteroidetes bacterium QH_7_62_13]|nr:MAG: 4-hydroxy-tetrahydrodipicolinate reductase [Bacteroidetes bacterium QH_7_62_13]
MKLALVGTGQMGEAVAQVAPDRGHEVVARFNSDRPFLETEPAALTEVDVAVDFSLPSLALDHIHRYCEWQQPAVVGTTGWADERDSVNRWVEEHNASLLYAPNFSIGVAVVRRALSAVLPLLDELDDYDPFVQEVHHTNKVDSPSGTAHMLGDLLVDGLDRKDHVDPETQHQRIDPAGVHVTSTRAGTVFGEHTVTLDGPYDQISLRHRAKNRRGFAAGAVRAAEWLDGREGLFTLDDVLRDWLAGDPTN